jgi:tripartite-type tricarboxylate transporter receptor subunit TctC
MVDPRLSGWMTGAARALMSGIDAHSARATMTNIPRTTATGVDELPADLQRLVVAVQALPEEHSNEVVAALERVVESTKRRRRILTLVQDALSQLRLDMKYLMFDLEATRRERDDFQSKLEQQES